MRQVTYRPRDGAVAVVDVPSPQLRPGWLLVGNRYSLISAGTERGKLRFGQQSLIGKARSRPDLVRTVIDKARVEGVRRTMAVARDRLDALAPIGYSSAGIVKAVGAGVRGFGPGDRVACGGAGWANHAEVVAVPENLGARVPEGVELADAAYATVGAIALHGIRQSEVSVGDHVGVVGLGLVGQLTVQILIAAGCKVIGIYLDARAIELAADAGASTFERNAGALEQKVLAASADIGLDCVLVCASTESPDPVQLATRLTRSRGRVVVVGNVPIVAPWALVYEKELEFRLSRSYGPGRYDREYEERGRDLPPEYVRWTEQRNMVAFLDLVASGRVRPSALTTHRFPIERGADAYDIVSGKSGARVRPFGVLLEYELDGEAHDQPPPAHQRSLTKEVRLGLIGAGAFARATLVPALAGLPVKLRAVASETGLSAADAAERLGFERAAASPDEIFEDESIGAVMIATRHSSHAPLAAAALRAGKAVFVEKPLALSEGELAPLEDALVGGGPLMVGFNRRFAPLTQRLHDEFLGLPDRVILARVNAGPLDDDHWMHDQEEGGRLLGEGCHFVDLLTHLVGSPPRTVSAFACAQSKRPLECSDSIVANLSFADGSVASLLYSGAGDSRLPKERIEAFGGGVAAVLDDFRRLEIYRGGKRTTHKQRQDKGHRAQVARFIAVASGHAEAPSADSYLISTRATFAVAESLRSGLPVSLP